MDVDGEEDSQFSASTCSLSWWMMKSLWKEGLPDEKLRLSIADTFLLKDGHLECWYFTSSKSGRVLKRANKRLDWDGLVKFLVQRARTPKGTTVTKDSWPPEVIATARRLRDGQTSPMMLTASDFKSLREKHNADLLDEIVAVQPYVTRTAFMGCGLFETEFQRNGRQRDEQAALSTFELAQWPQEDARRFEGFQSAAELPESRSLTLERRKVDRSAKRVHGVLHRVLAMTTRGIVEHVERETDEVVLRVVAQYAFVPGSGQPTLLWLDSVETGGSTQKQDFTFALDGNQSEIDANGAFAQLTRELVETNREWSTFFPPKMADISGGKLAAAGSGLGASQSPRSCTFSEKSEDDASSRAEESSSSVATPRLPKGESSKGALYSKPNVSTTTVEVLPSSESHPPMGVTFASSHHPNPTGFPEAGRVGERSRLRGRGQEAGYSTMNAGRAGSGTGTDGGGCRDNFTLPTESWARRSSRWRGLDISGTGEGGKSGARLSSKLWVRRRSMGTTMRFDDRRPDLRRGSESHRPQTAPPPVNRGLGEVGAGRAMAKRRGGPASVGTMSHRLPSKKNGCHGDYCNCEGMGPADDAEKSDRVGVRRGLNDRTLSVPPNVVPYRSILRSRAEEKALSLRPKSPKSQTGASKGRETFERTSTPGDGLVDLGLRGSKRRGNKASLASLVAERMRLLAANISDEGRGEYFSLRSKDRAKAGVPEAAQRAVEELIYEEALSHLHPTTIGRPVAVCDTCAMVYRQMDLCRKQTKSLKALAGANSREARIAWRRRLRREHQQKVLRDGDQTMNSSPHAVGVGVGSGEAALLRRYSELNLQAMPVS